MGRIFRIPEHASSTCPGLRKYASFFFFICFGDEQKNKHLRYIKTEI
ncbi:hypothetical protein HMPREF1981_02579 [Bacteroides pyogenes F0041]|uniref:Uncharacterized protein n=1 Tax=Bacteroides pyogenes F0041 TaxID=1321819 RepID=U2DQF0_9BACE|nr:hypothetical protein HMPREF1981_02579 [Bacteroides pyogenes F0041]